MCRPLQHPPRPTRRPAHLPRCLPAHPWLRHSARPPPHRLGRASPRHRPGLSSILRRTLRTERQPPQGRKSFETSRASFARPRPAKVTLARRTAGAVHGREWPGEPPVPFSDGATNAGERINRIGRRRAKAPASSLRRRRWRCVPRSQRRGARTRPPCTPRDVPPRRRVHGCCRGQSSEAPLLEFERTPSLRRRSGDVSLSFPGCLGTPTLSPGSILEPAPGNGGLGPWFLCVGDNRVAHCFPIAV